MPQLILGFILTPMFATCPIAWSTMESTVLVCKQNLQSKRKQTRSCIGYAGSTIATTGSFWTSSGIARAAEKRSPGGRHG